MASYFDNSYAHQSMGLPQKHMMHPMIDSNYNNRPKNMDLARVTSPMLEYVDAAHDPHIKIDDDLARVGIADANSLPHIWHALQQNVPPRSYSHDAFLLGSGNSTQASSSGTPSFGQDFLVGYKSQYAVGSSQEPSPLAVQKPMVKRNHRKIVKPRIATTYWEEEHTTCFQVRAHNVVVSRRENDDYINGTKLLNVTGMTRGKRDGMLKIEKGRLVVRNGLMNLKGVWIPFSRAVEIARNEGVDQLLYPLFVENIREFFQKQGQELRQVPMLDEEDEREPSFAEDDVLQGGSATGGPNGGSSLPEQRMFY